MEGNVSVCKNVTYIQTKEKAPEDMKRNVSVVMVHKYWVQFETSFQVFSS
jgi:hypothetical protein